MRRLAIMLAALCLPCGSLGAAKFADLRLTPDGSPDPPGDVLDLEVFFEPRRVRHDARAERPGAVMFQETVRLKRTPRSLRV